VVEPHGRSDTVPMLLAAGVAVVGILWAAAAASALLTGHAAPRHHLAGAVLAFAHFGNPSRAWQAPVGPPLVYWTLTVLVSVAAAVAAFVLRRAFAGAGEVRGSAVDSAAGLATYREVQRAAGVRRLSRRGRVLRPALVKPARHDLGYRLGRSRGADCWVSVEDSIVVLGPPRSGKGLNAVIPAILDAPGAVVTTSTRPDNLTATMRARERNGGRVAVFDPQHLAGLPSSLRWSPVRGCAEPHVAMARARALCSEPSRGMENATFWSQQCYTAVRCLLHAAALDGRAAVELYRWSLSPIAAEDAVAILAQSPGAAAAWDSALESILAADPRQRDSTWSMVANVFAPLADPRVLDSVSPRPGEEFDPELFLLERGTLYLLGTAAGASATANLVAALAEDVVETARRLAATSASARLEPPLAVILDEAANYPLPSLPSLMSDGGGTGITTMVVLQSLAQARDRWGTDAAAAIWDAAIVKVILGGSGNANDLRDLSALTGMRLERRANETLGADGRRSVSYSTHEVPLLDTGRLRTLPFGQGIMLLRSAPPILLHLQPWTSRPDARALTGDRAAVEAELNRQVDRTRL
jgi:type IV secretory pathway TraG/TraD family ATPase VirD4